MLYRVCDPLQSRGSEGAGPPFPYSAACYCMSTQWRMCEDMVLPGSYVHTLDAMTPSMQDLRTTSSSFEYIRVMG